MIEQGVHDGGFACIGVADQSDPCHACLHAAAPLSRALAADDLQLSAELGDPVLDAAAVQFQLLLARAFVGETAAAAALAGKFGTHAHQTGQHILEPGGLHLEPGFPCPGAGSENLQDQSGAVQDLRIENLLQVAHLHGSESLIEKYNVRIVLFDFFFQGRDLTAAHISGVSDGVGVLRDS